ncbi:MAG: tetratricopeptide repeat protein [Candidatus Cloacimonetes bacterium]|nr:tetratricopeptide repeat protein [Candidatus Cloacimonadota bacterium]
MIRNSLVILIILCAVGLMAQTPQTMIQNSYTYESTGDYVTAIELMHKLTQMDKSDAFYQLRLGWLYYSSGQYTQAELYYNASLQLEKTRESMEGLLNSAYAMGNWDKTISYAQQILKNNPNHFSALTILAYGQFIKKNFKDSANSYLKAVKLYPYNLEILGYLLSAQVNSDDKLGAEITYKKLKRYAPQNQYVLEYENSGKK